MTRGSDSSQSGGQRPLQGIRVLDFTRVLSGPHATRMLSDLGAEVIKVEPPMGDMTRFAMPRVNSLSSYFIQQNVGKKNISLDMTKPQAVELLKKLVSHCDVVIENFRPGVMRKMGLDYETLSQSNPRLIYTSITGYGATGPWTTRRAYAPVVNAESGITKHQGDVRGGQYANDPHSHGDVYTALEAASAILAALFQREQTGFGQYIDVSMAETMLYVNEHAHNQLWTGVEPDGEIRSFQPADYPVLTVADGSMVVVSGHPAERGTFDYFVAAMQQPELLTDPRFGDVATRLEHFDELMDLMRAWAKTVPTSDEIENRLSQHQLAVGRLRSVSELADTEWANERDAVVLVSDRGDGTVRIPNSPWHFSGSDTTTQGDAKYRGEDNRAIFSEIAGLSGEEIAQLEKDGVLVSRGPSKR
jgi:crotonobetainyl-CoA:carnitine CoA-transferase CaiB-like acyl-CoA transferase